MVELDRIFKPVANDNGLFEFQMYLDGPLISALNLYSSFFNFPNKQFQIRMIESMMELYSNSFNYLKENCESDYRLSEHFDSVREWELEREQNGNFEFVVNMKLSNDFFDNYVVKKYLERGYSTLEISNFGINFGVQDFLNYLRGGEVCLDYPN